MQQFDLFTYLLAQQNGGGGTGGSGINYKSMTINSDNTITIIDLEDTEHTLVPTYTDNVITAITYDGKNVKLEYDNDGNLIKIGDSDVDLENYEGVANTLLTELLTLVTPQTETLEGCYEQLDSDRDDLADNLVTMGVAASHSETITSLVPKVLTIPSGSNIGYEVKFKVDGNDYYVAQCLQGESITAPPTPTNMQGGIFAAWQLNNTDVSFPFTPSANIELIARAQDITVTTAGTPLYTYSGGTITKQYDNADENVTVYGYCIYNTTQKFLFLVSKIANNTAMSGNQMTGGIKISFTYNNETWYFTHSNATTTTSIDHGAANIGDYGLYANTSAMAKAILDVYFGV